VPVAAKMALARPALPRLSASPLRAHAVAGNDASAESRGAADLAAWIADVSDADLVIASVAGADGLATEAEANRAAETCARESREGSAVRRITTRGG